MVSITISPLRDHSRKDQNTLLSHSAAREYPCEFARADARYFLVPDKIARSRSICIASAVVGGRGSSQLRNLICAEEDVDRDEFFFFATITGYVKQRLREPSPRQLIIKYRANTQGYAACACRSQARWIITPARGSSRALEFARNRGETLARSWKPDNDISEPSRFPFGGRAVNSALLRYYLFHYSSAENNFVPGEPSNLSAVGPGNYL